MPRFKRLSFIVILLLQFSGAALAQNQAAPEVDDRKTSKPYTGDLTILVLREEISGFRSIA